MLAAAAFALAGFLAAALAADAALTRDGIKRSGGRIVEGNRAMRWFVRTDLRVTALTLIECSLVFAAVAAFASFDAPWAGIVFSGTGLAARVPVVIRNYRLNVRIIGE